MQHGSCPHSAGIAVVAVFSRKWLRFMAGASRLGTGPGGGKVYEVITGDVSDHAGVHVRS